MLDYIYQGEVQIQQEYLDRFIEVATKFKLSGILTTDGEGEIEETEETLRETTENEYRHHKIEPKDNKKSKPQYFEERSIGPINQIFVENVAEIDQKFAELIEKEDD